MSGSERTAVSEATIDAHQRLVFGIALRILGDAALAEDVTVAVFVALAKARIGSNESGIRSWLVYAARQRALAVLRASIVTASEGDDLGEAWLGERAIPKETHRWNRTDAKRTLATLSRLERRAIELVYFEGMGIDEIARRGGVDRAVVAANVRTGLEKLRASTAKPSREPSVEGADTPSNH